MHRALLTDAEGLRAALPIPRVLELYLGPLSTEGVRALPIQLIQRAFELALPISLITD